MFIDHRLQKSIPSSVGAARSRTGSGTFRSAGAGFLGGSSSYKHSAPLELGRCGLRLKPRCDFAAILLFEQFACSAAGVVQQPVLEEKHD